MLSIIISTYRPDYLCRLAENIRVTVGIPYELIAIDNSGGAMGICRAYNTGAERAQYHYLCFIHEDVEIVAKDWGKGILELLEREKVDLLGVAGSKYKPSFISGWTTGSPLFDRVSIYHKRNNGELQQYLVNKDNETISQVVALDGVCLFMGKKLWEEFLFDEQIRGFHFYDLDLSLRLHAAGKKVFVTYSFPIVHFSQGKFDDTWFEAAYQFHKRKKKLTGLNCSGIHVGAVLKRSIKLMWLSRLTADGIQFNNLLKLYFNYKTIIFFKGYYKCKAVLTQFLSK